MMPQVPAPSTHVTQSTLLVQVVHSCDT